MKPLLLSLFALLTTSFCTFGQTDFYSQRWSEVYKYELNQLPKSALAVTDTLYTRAKRERNVPQLVKALIYKSKFSLALQEDAELLIIHRLEKEIKESAPPLSNIIENVVASLYWQYFRQHRYKFYQRTHTDEKVNAGDFRTWDLKPLFNEIHTRYQRSLTHPAMLQKVSLATLNDILDPAENSKTYRPTLFDLLSHNALEFYLTDENSITAPAARFKLNDKRYFDGFDAVTLTIPTDSLSLQFQALKIYHNLIAFHKRQNNINAFVDLELQRLSFITSHGKFDNAAQRHKQALLKLRAGFAHHAASTLIDFALASILNREGETYNREKTPGNRFTKREAMVFIDSAIARFPASEGALKCLALKNNILSRQVNLTIEKFIPIGTQSRLLVQYKNTDSLSFFAFRVTQHFKERFYNTRDERARLAMLDSLTPVVQWRAALKNEYDYHLHRTEVITPPMPQGNYLLVASTTKTPRYEQKATIAYAPLQVTNLVMTQQVLSPNNQRYQVVNRNSGKPLEGAGVHISNINSRHNNNALFDRHFITGKTGFIEVASPHQQVYNLQALVTWQSDTAIFGEYNLRHYTSGNDDHFNARVFFFTDRSIYRPGQTVYFKGIMIKTLNEKSSVVTGESIDVILDDVNGQEAGKLTLRTNTFGSFSGTFTLPAGGLMGEYKLSAREPAKASSEFYDALDYFDGGNVNLSVEEYKRPTFETTFEPVKNLYKAGDTITVKGSATAFSGALIGGAMVRYRVKRTIQFPRWYYWHRPAYHHGEASQEITHGQTLTGSDGKFIIVFKAIPGADANPDNRPVFFYEVTADITDINGETRSATATVKVGYHTLEATLNVTDTWNMNAAHNTIAFATENLNGEHVGAKGTLRVYKLVPPAAPLRPRPWDFPDFQIIPAGEFAQLFPHDAYQDEADPTKWKRGAIAFEAPFDSDINREVNVNTNQQWQPGRYEIELHTTDPSGLPVTDKQRVALHDPSGKVIADNELVIFELDKPTYKPGEIAHLKIGSASADITLTIDIEKDHRVVNTFVEHLSATTREIAIPVTKDAANGFAIHYSSVNYNTLLSGTRVVPVTVPQPALDIETLTFRDKLRPGAKETWSFRIKGKHGSQKEAEVLVSMYDASLDQFRDHQWHFNPIPRHPYYSYNSSAAYEGFGVQGFNIYNHPSFYAIPARRYDRLDWSGLGFDRNYNNTRRYLDRLYVSRDSTSGISKITVSNDRRKKAGYVYGVVTDETGAPLSGVSVVVKHTLTGAITDDNGSYAVQAMKGSELIFSYIGYSTVSATVGSNTIDVAMAVEVQALSEVVVVGYGMQEKRDLTGAVVSLKATSTVQAADADYEFISKGYLSLSGRAAGVTVTGMPGGTASIMIRGQNFEDLNPLPLYVVDGVVVASTAVDHNDLASIEVLKGQDAMALYGARGANGVIVITTRSGQKKIDDELARINARVNLNETAFFFPHITTSTKARMSFSFTSPEALTRWKLQVLAHTPSLVSATKTLLTVTQKKLMVTPNAPRFLRTNDEIVLSAKIANLSGQDMQGMAALQLTDAITGAPLDSRLGNTIRNLSFNVTAQGSTQVSWTLHIPEGVEAVQYKVVAKTDNTSDGEQNVLPVLPNRMLVTETMPMAVRTGETKTFHLNKLQHHNSPTLKHHRLTLEVTANPVWYAVQALPYLLEFPHECAEQIFSRYYANTLATHIGNSTPRIRAVFDQWAAAGGTVSNLEKNNELKSIIIQETPWLRDAQSETEQQKRVGLLFDLNTMRGQLRAALDKLGAMQLGNGGFPWFSGNANANRYITRHIASGYGHLKHLGASSPGDQAGDMMKKAVLFLDNDILEEYRAVQRRAKATREKAKTEADGLQRENELMTRRNVGHDHIQYLYMRSFYSEVETTAEVAAARAYYLKQSATYWPYFNLHMKAMVALTHHRSGNDSLANGILRSLKENAITTDEMGMYWKENTPGWHWSEAPVETQALIIEAFSEIDTHNTGQTSRTLDDLRLWLLKNKQTTQWKTTKATTEAIYALLLKGNDWLAAEEQPLITVGHATLDTGRQRGTQAEAGTGYLKTSWEGNVITPAMGEVTLAKKEKGISFAGLYWQYFEDLDKITPAETSLKLTRKLFLVTHTEQGEVLTAADSTTALKTGNLLRVRIELRADRNIEFVHMKDMRAAGLEPVSVLSAYKWQDGLGYYESTKDAATHFFFDEVPKGIYVLEYNLRVNNKGNFSNGITTIQCMYAPEFSSHSEGMRIIVE